MKNVVHMVDKAKMTTISARVEEDLLVLFDRVAEALSINKSDFLRACLDKLCHDNRILLDHCDKVPRYLAFIKNELKSLPPDLIRIKNGSWDDLKDSVILLLCNDLWQSSRVVFNKWKELADRYNIFRELEEEEITEFSQAQDSEGLFSLEAIVFVLAEKSGQVERTDLQVLLSKKYWLSGIEADIVSLSYAVKEALESQPAQVLIRKFLEIVEEEKGDAPMRIVIDATGGFSRSGYTLHLPISYEKMKGDNETIQ